MADSKLRLYSFGRAKGTDCAECFPGCRHPASHVPPGSRVECVRTAEITASVLRKYGVLLSDLKVGGDPIGLTTLNNHSRINSISVKINSDSGATFSLQTRSGDPLPTAVKKATTDYDMGGNCNSCEEPVVTKDAGELTGFGALPAGKTSQVIEQWMGPDALNTKLDELQLVIDSVPATGLKAVPDLVICINYETSAFC